jgi:glycosyltransferase involved in cell wall biosynthesis
MLIGFDAKRFFKNYTGLGNYSRFIINALCDFYPDNQYFLFTPTVRSHPEVNPILQKKNIEVITPHPLFSKFGGGSIWRTWGISKEKVTKQLEIFHGLSQELPVGLPKGVKRVVTVHDLIYLRYPQFYNPIDVKIYTAKVRFACKHSDKIIAISEQTAHDIETFLGIDKSKIIVIYQGCHPGFKRKVLPDEKEKIKAKYGLPEKYLLNVGTIEERKNALLLVKSLLHIPEKLRFPVVIAGKATKYSELIKDFVVENKLGPWVKFLHNASFADFPGLYQNAEAFIYPSLFEGFGIPLVEAIESGVPVITSAGTSFREAAGPHSMYIDSRNSEELAKAILDVTQDKNIREKMIAGSSQYIQRFQPGVIASELDALYHAMLSHEPVIL